MVQYYVNAHTRDLPLRVLGPSGGDLNLLISHLFGISFLTPSEKELSRGDSLYTSNALWYEYRPFNYNLSLLFDSIIYSTKNQ